MALKARSDGVADEMAVWRMMRTKKGLKLRLIIGIRFPKKPVFIERIAGLVEW